MKILGEVILHVCVQDILKKNKFMAQWICARAIWKSFGGKALVSIITSADLGQSKVFHRGLGPGQKISLQRWSPVSRNEGFCSLNIIKSYYQSIEIW